MEFPLGLHAHADVYLIAAVVCLVIALHYARRALTPLGPLLHAVTSAVVATIAIGLALALLIATILSGDLS